MKLQNTEPGGMTPSLKERIIGQWAFGSMEPCDRPLTRIFAYVQPDQMEALFAGLSPRGVCVITTRPTEQEANDFLHRMARVCRGANKAAS